MIVCGIESTCDETSVGVVKDGVEVVSFVVASSALMQEKYGGIVPEVAAREQVKFFVPVLQEAFADFDIRKVDAFAVANGPGLIGSLLIGVETAKCLSVVFGRPLIAVNHLVGHLYANWVSEDISKFSFPAIGLVISGGHTDLVLMRGHNDFKLLGGTLDDAVGEALDKIARILNLKYPGGPEIESLASNFKSTNLKGFDLPMPMIHSQDFNFSFSGLKTAVINLVNRNPGLDKSQLCFELQETISKILLTKTLRAASTYKAKSIIVGGGVSANNYLRNLFSQEFFSEGIDLFFPEKRFSTDNGVMIASAGFFKNRYPRPKVLGSLNFAQDSSHPQSKSQASFAQNKFFEPLKVTANPSLYF